MKSHATVKTGGYVIPLIGVPMGATAETCVRCREKFHLIDIVWRADGKFYCHPCLKKHENKNRN